MKTKDAGLVMSARIVDIYPHKALARLAESIKDGGADAAAIASAMIDELWTMTGCDGLMTAFYLNRVLRDLDGVLRKEYTWLTKLTKLTPRMTDFTEIGDIEVMRTSFLEYVGQIISIISKYRLAARESIIKAACSYILENVDEPLSLDALAKKLYISNSYLSLLFKQKTGINLNNYIAFAKMERSRVLIEEGQLRSYEIAEKIGFSVEYFSKLFKKTYTISPMEYRKTL